METFKLFEILALGDEITSLVIIILELVLDHPRSDFRVTPGRCSNAVFNDDIYIAFMSQGEKKSDLSFFETLHRC